jgi:hypothetical protein
VQVSCRRQQLLRSAQTGHWACLLLGQRDVNSSTTETLLTTFWDDPKELDFQGACAHGRRMEGGQAPRHFRWLDEHALRQHLCGSVRKLPHPLPMKSHTPTWWVGKTKCRRGLEAHVLRVQDGKEAGLSTSEEFPGVSAWLWSSRMQKIGLTWL